MTAESIFEQANKVERRVAGLVIESLCDALCESMETLDSEFLPARPFLKTLAEKLNEQARVLGDLPPTDRG